jgi:hypothetical protein
MSNLEKYLNPYYYVIIDYKWMILLTTNDYMSYAL